MARRYVDFIRVRPWYEFDFATPLGHVWTREPFFGPHLARKLERKFALTAEYSVKMVYGFVIKLATHASYGVAEDTTAVILDRPPDLHDPALASLKFLRSWPNGSFLATVPRYQAFCGSAQALARQGVNFREIAGNPGNLLVSAIADEHWQPSAACRVLFTQPVITRPGITRFVFIVNVTQLADLLRRWSPGVDLEHIYDY